MVILSQGTPASADIFMAATVLREIINEAFCIIQLYYNVQQQQNFKFMTEVYNSSYCFQNLYPTDEECSSSAI